jgi:hypothetical protein
MGQIPEMGGAGPRMCAVGPCAGIGVEMIRQAYVAGSYSSCFPCSVLLNIRAALKAGLQILEVKGWHPIIPHASMSHDTEWHPAMDRCADVIRSMDAQRDCLVLLPGWEKSRGACWEKEFAKSLGMDILTLEEALS